MAYLLARAVGRGPFTDKTWKLVVGTITVGIGETMPPGFYAINMTLDQVAY